MYWTLELASKLEDAPWPATREELIDYAMRSGAPLEVIENLQEMEDEGEVYECIEDIWPDYPSKEDFFFHKVEHTGVDHSAASDTLYLLGCFNQIAARHYMSALLVEHHFAVELSGLYTLWHHPISFENLHSPQK